MPMRVLELWRYPVKSMQGEPLTEAEVECEGIAGDRRWALFDLDTGLGLTARRVPDLLFATGRLRADGGVQVVLPDGTVTADDGVLSDWLGRRVALRSATEMAGRRRYESPDDDDRDDADTRWRAWEGGGGGAFHDDARGRVSLVTTGTLGTWDRRRFRSNVVLEGPGEGGLIGSQVRVGAVVLDVGDPIPRCVMVTRPQPGGIARDTDVLRTIHRRLAGDLAVAAQVHRPGKVRVGEVLEPA